MNTDTAPTQTPAWRFDHLNVSMGSATALSALFEGVMGFASGPRPSFPFPGTWLYEGDQALVHAVDDPALSATTGEMRLGHVAFRSDEPASQVIKRVRRSALPFKVAQISEDNMAQIFVLLPGGLVVELDVPNDTAEIDHTYSAHLAAPVAAHF